MSDEAPVPDDVAVRLFGDPLSAVIYRGPERRSPSDPEAGGLSSRDLQHLPALTHERHMEPIPTIRTGKGDGYATLLFVLGVTVLVITIGTGSLILYNAKTVGAFSNPWDSTRVALGLAVLAVGIVQSALLVGLSRATSYLLALLRLRSHDLERHHPATERNSP